MNRLTALSSSLLPLPRLPHIALPTAVDLHASDYRSFHCTNYPVWPWMSLWSAVRPWWTRLTVPPSANRNKAAFDSWRHQTRLWRCVCSHFLFHKMISLLGGSGLIQHYTCIHASCVILPCMCTYQCISERRRVGTSTGWYILLCGHLCPTGSRPPHTLPPCRPIAACF